MKPRTLLILVSIVVFAAVVAFALWREVAREEAELAHSISGVVEVSPALYASGAADIVRTDRIVLMLLDPAGNKPVALRFDTPFVPPQTFVIGQKYTRGVLELAGKYILVGITDKDGEIFKITPGEIYGRSPEPITLGSEKIRLILSEPFRGSVLNTPGGQRAAAPAPVGENAPRAPAQPRPLGAAMETPERAIQGVVRVAEGLKDRVTPGDRLLIMLFDPDTGRPAATKMIPHVYLPQAFTIGLRPGTAPNAGKAYSLRILTDKDNNPVNAVPGEIVGRSAAPIPLGTANLDFVLDKPYTR